MLQEPTPQPHYYDCHCHQVGSEREPVPSDITVLLTAARINDWPTIASRIDGCGIFGACGLHPWYAESWQESLHPGELLRQYLSLRGMVAVGEIGLDAYNELRESLPLQVVVFRRQLELATELALPVILHVRKAWAETLACLKDFPQLRGICHNFSGDRQVAEKLLTRDFYFSFGGPITFTRNKKQREIAAFLPLERLLTETDAPDCPVSSRQPGEPGKVSDIYQVTQSLADLRQISQRDFLRQIAENWHAFSGDKLSPCQNGNSSSD